MHITRTDCRCCRATNLTEVFNLGEQPFANAFLRPNQLDQPEPTCPLVVMECADCGHVQLSHVADPAELYRNYSFETGTSQNMGHHFAELMRSGVSEFVSKRGLVVEIGSNDGTALASIERRDVRRLGIDPAENLAAIATSRGVETLPEFFSESLAKNVLNSHGEADLIVACNVLAHIDDLDDFCRGIKQLLSADGALIIEVPYVKWLVSNDEFDTIYHEHLSYFALRPLIKLFSRHDLDVVDVMPKSVHGGTLRVTVQRALTEPKPSVAEWAADEADLDWPAFRSRCEALRTRLRTWLTSERECGRTVWGYGAPAKGTVLLNYCDIGRDLLPCVVDSTTSKQGRHMPGTHQPILAPEELLQQMPAAAIVLAWNHFQEIENKEFRYIESGGQMKSPHVTLFPSVHRNRSTVLAE